MSTESAAETFKQLMLSREVRHACKKAFFVSLEDLLFSQLMQFGFQK